MNSSTFIKKVKKMIVVPSFLIAFLFGVTPAFAHVTVKPAQVGVAQYNDFVISVPNEETTPTVQVRLVIPEGLKNVAPNVKPGWNIQVKKSGEGDSEHVSEVIWSGGSIPVGQRDQFVFSAQTPATESVLVWKAYQTYGDGDTVAWETDPATLKPMANGEDDHDAPRPYSSTKVVNDLAVSVTPATVNEDTLVKKSSFDASFVLSLVSLALSAYAVSLVLKNRKKSAVK